MEKIKQTLVKKILIHEIHKTRRLFQTKITL